MNSSLERIVPDQLAEDDAFSRETLDLHLERYRFAAGHARPGRLLDMACGVGYGTDCLLAAAPDRIREVVAVDVDEEAIGYARRRYGRPGVSFIAADATGFTDDDGFDTIVSLETVEHLPDPQGFLARLAGLLRPEGVLVASVPTTPSVDVNPYHRTDFTAASFVRMLAAKGLSVRDRLVQVQPYGLRGTLFRKQERMQDLRGNLVGYYALHPLAAGRRILATLRYGFTNRYLTVSAARSGEGTTGCG
jgi:2-polyprenyl-3-methyl-5-hydroxy-6-metoxy-1,4-benzoquinol methylase